MVLGDLGAKITNALKKLQSKQTIDEATLNELLTEIASALLSSDVNIKFIAKLRDAVKTKATLQMSTEMGGANLRKLITSTVVDELT
jgi:signal recognition particle subunit SRP54